MENRKPWIYIAGPFTNGDVAQNVSNAMLVGDRLRLAGAVPIIPHLFHFVHMVSPHGYRYWMDWDLDLLSKCDVILRLPGASSGADEEVEIMQSWGRKVFYNEADATSWLDSQVFFNDVESFHAKALS